MVNDGCCYGIDTSNSQRLTVVLRQGGKDPITPTPHIKPQECGCAHGVDPQMPRKALELYLLHR